MTTEVPGNEWFEAESTRDGLKVRLRGDWSLANAEGIQEALATLARAGGRERGAIEVDASAVEGLDLASAWLLHRSLESLGGDGRVVVADPRPPTLGFVEEITKKTAPPDEAAATSRRGLAVAIAALGRVVVRQVHQAHAAIGYFGEIVVAAAGAALHPRRFRLPAIVRQIHETGIQAIPIVSLIAFLISVIVAYLSAQQLRQFGADIFTVDLVTIAVLRELAVLLTAIIVAGRSGSAFAAEIGVMRLNDEVDALRSIGISPFEVLVVPRMIGLLVALPLLTVIADLMGLAGGMVLTWLLLDIPFVQFLGRMQEILAPTTFWAGLVKAPVFAALIAMVGTYRGMQVRDSSRELGRLTTVAVVESIFLVIFADAIFAVIFVEIDF